MHRFQDIHTHTEGRPGAILSAPPLVAMRLADAALSPAAAWEDMDAGKGGQYYSLELHPWHADASMCHDFMQAVEACQSDPHLVAIGECGIDSHSEIPIEQQLKAFRLAVETAHQLKLPVIVHCVGRWAEVIGLHRQYPDVPMIIHGFRKGWTLAQQLLHEGIAISLGEKYQPEVAAAVPEELLYYETDESTANICEIRENILSLRPKYGNNQ